MKVIIFMAYTGLCWLKRYTRCWSSIAAKKAKNFVEADRIRKELLETGIVLEDTPLGTTWRRA
jgi:cysteinyl-tRNA synthetase